MALFFSLRVVLSFVIHKCKKMTLSFVIIVIFLLSGNLSRQSNYS